MRFEQVQRFILAKNNYFGFMGTLTSFTHPRQSPFLKIYFPIATDSRLWKLLNSKPKILPQQPHLICLWTVLFLDALYNNFQRAYIYKPRSTCIFLPVWFLRASLLCRTCCCAINAIIVNKVQWLWILTELFVLYFCWNFCPYQCTDRNELSFYSIFHKYHLITCWYQGRQITLTNLGSELFILSRTASIAKLKAYTYTI